MAKNLCQLVNLKPPKIKASHVSYMDEVLCRHFSCRAQQTNKPFCKYQRKENDIPIKRRKKKMEDDI